MMRRKTHSFVLAVLLAAAAGLSRSHGGEPPKDLDGIIRKLLVAKDSSERFKLRRAYHAARRGVSDADVRKKLEAAAGAGGLSEAGGMTYLELGGRLGPSEFYQRKALELLDKGSPQTFSGAVYSLCGYLDKDPRPASGKKLAAVVWRRMDDPTIKQKGAALSVLFKLDAERTRTYFLQAIRKKKWTEDQRQRLIRFLCADFPKDVATKVLKTEMKASETPTYRQVLRVLLDRLVGEKEADRLFDAAPPCKVSTAKVKAEYKGKSQSQLWSAGVSMEVIEFPADHALFKFRREVGMDIRWNAEADRVLAMHSPMTVRFRKTPASQALARMLVQVGLAPRWKRDHVEVFKGKVPDTTTAEQKTRLLKAMARKVRLRSKGRPMGSSLRMLGMFCGASVVFDSSVTRTARRKKLAGDYQDTSAKEVLDDILKQSGLKWRFMHGCIQVCK